MSEKVAIYSEFKTVANIIYNELKDKYENTEIILLSGDTEQEDREQAIKLAKSTDKNVIMIFTKILSYGMNLDEFDTLIVYTLPWNPAVLSQVEDRIHRLDSTRRKTVVHLISGDVENYVYSVINKKRKLSDKAVDGMFNMDNDVLKYIQKVK